MDKDFENISWGNILPEQAAKIAQAAGEEINRFRQRIKDGDNASKALKNALRKLVKISNAISVIETNEMDYCNCDNCFSIRERARDEGWQCRTCGYKGKPGALSCTCLDVGCNSAFPVSGCGHGSISCPVCEDGEGDVDLWEMIKKVREILTQEKEQKDDH